MAESARRGGFARGPVALAATWRLHPLQAAHDTEKSSAAVDARSPPCRDRGCRAQRPHPACARVGRGRDVHALALVAGGGYQLELAPPPPELPPPEDEESLDEDDELDDAASLA